MCFAANKRRFQYDKDAFAKNKARRLTALAHAATQLTDTGPTSSHSPLISRTLNAEDETHASDRESLNNEKWYSARDSGDEGSVINLISSSPSRHSVHDPDESAPIVSEVVDDIIVTAFPADVPENDEANFVFPPNVDEGAPSADFQELQGILRIPGAFEDLFGGSIQGDPPDDSPAYTHPADDGPFHSDGTCFDGHQLELLDLSPPPQESDHGSEDDSQYAQSNIMGRKRLRRNFHGKFWETVNFLCHEYDPPTREKPFPILSRYYMNPIRICNRLSIRRRASTKAIEFADSGWRTFTTRYGHLSPLQNEERRIFDHLIYTLSHYPHAICIGDVRKKEDVLQFLKIACNYFDCLCKEERKIQRRAQRLTE